MLRNQLLALLAEELAELFQILLCSLHILEGSLHILNFAFEKHHLLFLRKLSFLTSDQRFSEPSVVSREKIVLVVESFHLVVVLVLLSVGLHFEVSKLSFRFFELFSETSVLLAELFKLLLVLLGLGVEGSAGETRLH